MQRLAGHRMTKVQRAGVQRLPRDPGRTVRIVEKISGEWIPQMGKMYTDLVGASGLKTDAQQRKSTGRNLRRF